MRVVAVLAAGAVVVGGCLSTPDPAAVDASGTPADAPTDAPAGCVDEDDDGWPTGPAGMCGRHVDCDPDNELHYPGAREDGDGVGDLDCVPGPMQGPDAPDLVNTSLGSGRRITSRGARMEFHPNASHQLSSLQTGSPSVELLFTGAMNERWSGTNVWEGYFSTQATGTPELTDGHAVIQWRVPFTTAGLTGASLYTIHLDGRIQRSDTFNVSAQPTMPSLKSVTSYVALDASRFDDVTWREAGPDGEQDIDQGSGFATYFSPIPDTPTWLCARNALNDVVWAFAPGTAGPGPNPAPRITSSSDLWGAQVALQYDFTFAQSSVALGDHTGNFLLVPAGRSGGSLDCGYAGQIARSYYEPARLTITGTAVSILDDPGDVNRDGYVEVGGYYLVDAMGAGFGVEIDTAGGRASPPVSTFRIRNLSLDPPPVVTRTPPGGGTSVMVHGQHYRFQQDGTGAWLVLLVDLQNGGQFEIVRPYQP